MSSSSSPSKKSMGIDAASSPIQRRSNRSPRKTPQSQRRPHKNQRFLEPTVIDKDIMNSESDLGHGGNLDNEAMAHPPNVTNLTNIFDDDDVDNLIWETLKIDGNEGEITEHSHDREETNHPNLSSLNSSSRTLQSIPQPNPTHQSVQSIPQPNPSHQIPEDIPEWVRKQINGYILTKALTIRKPVKAGYKHPPTDDELSAISTLKGNIDYKICHNRYEKEPRIKPVRGFKGAEILTEYKCGAPKCKSKMIVARYMNLLLCYEKVDEATGEPIPHSNHNLKRKTSRTTAMTLTEEQKEYVKNHCMGDVSVNKWRAIAESMKNSYDCQLSPEQEKDLEGLAKKVREYVNNGRRRNDPKFVNLKGNEVMSGNLCKYILDVLMIDPSKRSTQGNPFTTQLSDVAIKSSASPDISPSIAFATNAVERGVQNVSSESGARVETLPPNVSSERESHANPTTAQLPTVADRNTASPPSSFESVPFMNTDDFETMWNQLQVVDHDYDGNGSTFTYILLHYNDVKKRAAKAVEMYGDKGVQLEMDFFLGVCPGNEWQIGHIGISDKDHKYWILALVIVRSENSDAAGILLHHALGLLADAGGRGNGVLVDGGKALAKAIKEKNEVRALLAEHRLYIRRCFSHCLRAPFSRGGGYRGGQGSVFRALLNDHVPRKIISKIVALLNMMNFIVPGDIESFKAATNLLLKEFDEYLSKNFRAQYLTHDPNDIGGLCAGRHGEVASTQGAERRGGWIKEKRKDRVKSKNPILFIHAAACDGERKTNDIENFFVEPNYSRVGDIDAVYDQLRGLSRFNEGSGTNFCSDFLYATCFQIRYDDSGHAIKVEVPLHVVLGVDGTVFEVRFPSVSTQFTELKLMLLQDAQDVIGAPMAFQSLVKSPEDVRKMLQNPVGCTQQISCLDLIQKTKLKTRIRNRSIRNTPQPLEGETCKVYLQRRAHRDLSEDAFKRFASNSAGKAKPKGKKKKRMTEHEQKLEQDKWGTKEQDDGDKILNEEYVVLDLDEEIEDWEGAIEWALGEKGVDDGKEGSADYFAFSCDDIARLNRDAQNLERVRVLRELGDEITIHVDGKGAGLCCNCEKFNRWSVCQHVIWMEVLHFGKYPPGHISTAEDGWDSIRQRILSTVKSTHISLST